MPAGASIKIVLMIESVPEFISCMDRIEPVSCARFVHQSFVIVRSGTCHHTEINISSHGHTVLSAKILRKRQTEIERKENRFNKERSIDGVDKKREDTPDKGPPRPFASLGSGTWPTNPWLSRFPCPSQKEIPQSEASPKAKGLERQRRGGKRTHTQLKRRDYNEGVAERSASSTESLLSDLIRPGKQSQGSRRDMHGVCLAKGLSLMGRVTRRRKGN